MRLLRLTWVLVPLVVMGATASVAVAEPEFLPGNAKEAFKIKSGATKIQIKGGETIECTKSELKGELLSSKTAVGTTTFNGCTMKKNPVNSVGAAKETIVAPSLFSDCLWRGISLDNCLKYHFDKSISLEVPLTKTKLTVEGGFISNIGPSETKTEKFTLEITEKEGIQGIEKAEGEKSAESLKISTNEGAFVQSGIEMKEATLEFETGKPQELMK